MPSFSTATSQHYSFLVHSWNKNGYSLELPSVGTALGELAFALQSKSSTAVPLVSKLPSQPWYHAWAAKGGKAPFEIWSSLIPIDSSLIHIDFHTWQPGVQ